DAIGDAAVKHELAGEDEERDREEGEDVHPRVHALENHRERQPFPENGGYRGEADRARDRHAEEQPHGERSAEEGQRHAGTTPSPRMSAITCSIENSTISAPEITSGAWLKASEMPSVGIL